MQYIKKLVESTIPKTILLQPQYRDINNKVLQPLALLTLLQYNTDKIIPKVVDLMNVKIMPLLQSRGNRDLRGYVQTLNQSLNELQMFLSHFDLKKVPFEHVLLLSAVISKINLTYIKKNCFWKKYL